MRHKNSIKQLGKLASHRKAMFSNMVTSLFTHERIITTRQKGRELKKISERLITRAKRNLFIEESDSATKLHNKREVMRLIKNRDIVSRLFENIAPRFRERNGGYTRMYLLGKRQGDGAEMAIVELVEKEKPEKSDTAKKQTAGKK